MSEEDSECLTCTPCTEPGRHLSSHFALPPPPAALSGNMSGIEIVGIVLAIPGILDLINRAAVAIKNVRCPIVLQQRRY